MAGEETLSLQFNIIEIVITCEIHLQRNGYLILNSK